MAMFIQLSQGSGVGLLAFASWRFLVRTGRLKEPGLDTPVEITFIV